MKLGIDWTQSSTVRGLIWVVAAVTALVFYWFGKDPLPVMAVGGGLAGGLGVALKD
jgi:hypothetical protein